MKKIKRLKNKATLILLIISLFAGASGAYAEVVDRVLAVVNDELITQSELDRILVSLYNQYKSLYAGDELLLKMDEKRREVLNLMINDKLILSEARRHDIPIDPEEIEEKVEELRGKFKSEEIFEGALVRQGISLKDLHNKYRDELLKDKYIAAAVRVKISITPTEIKEYYDANADEFKIPPGARVSNILIRIEEDGDREGAYNKAQEVLERLKKGDDFAEMARVYSGGIHAEDGGDMGYLNEGQLKEEVDKIIFSLQIGEFSDIVETESGYHIFMVTEKKRPLVMNMEEAYEEIRSAIYRQKAMEKFNEVIEGLKKNAYISIK